MLHAANPSEGIFFLDGWQEEDLDCNYPSLYLKTNAKKRKNKHKETRDIL